MTYIIVVCVLLVVAACLLASGRLSDAHFDFSLRFGLGDNNYVEDVESAAEDDTDVSDDDGVDTVSSDPSAEDSEESVDDPDDFIDIDGEKLSVALAPIILDVSKCTNIDVIDAVHRRNAAVFVTPTSEDANALVELFVVVMPMMAEKFARGGVWSGKDYPYGVDAIVGLDKCENCGDYHFDVKVTVLVPFARVGELTENVHRFFYPDGIKDIVDVIE